MRKQACLALSNHSLGNLILSNFDMLDSKKVYKIDRIDKSSNTLDHWTRNSSCTFHRLCAIYNHHIEHIVARSNYTSRTLVDDNHSTTDDKHKHQVEDALLMELSATYF